MSIVETTKGTAPDVFKNNKENVKKVMGVVRNATVIETWTDFESKVINGEKNGANMILTNYEAEMLSAWKALPEKMDAITTYATAKPVRTILGREVTWTALLMWATATADEQEMMEKDTIGSEYINRGAARFADLQKLVNVKPAERTAENLPSWHLLLILGCRMYNSRLNGRYSFTGARSIWARSDCDLLRNWANKPTINRNLKRA